jgi:hypothetical protein
MSWETIKDDIEADWREAISWVESEAPKIEAILQEILAGLAALSLGGGGHVVADVSAVAQALYAATNVVATDAAAVAPPAGAITATQLVGAAVALTNAVPGLAAALKTVATTVDTTVSDLEGKK